MLIYPEGTTWNNGLEVEGIFEKSDALARACNREPFTHVMFPKHKGFYRLLSSLRERLDAVYDMTFAYSTTRTPEGRKPAPGMVREYSPSSMEPNIGHSKETSIGHKIRVFHIYVSMRYDLFWSVVALVLLEDCVFFLKFSLKP